MLSVLRLIFNGASEPVKGTLNEVKDEALSTLRFYKYVALGLVVSASAILILILMALLKVVFGG